MEDNKLTVLFVSNQGGGAPRSLLNMIGLLRAWVHPIVLFENDWYDYQAFVKAGIECIIVPYRLNYVPIEKEYKTMRWRTHRLIDEFWLNGRVAQRVKKVLAGRKIDIVHVNTGAIAIGKKISDKLGGVKFVWHLREFQDLDFGGHPYGGWKKFFGQLHEADALIGITKAIGEHFKFGEMRNATVAWDAVRPTADACMEKNKDNYILYCSSMIVHAKGLHDLLYAYGQSTLPHKGTKLKCVGILEEGEYKQQCMDIIRKLGIGKMVEFYGTQNDVKPFFTKAKAFVLPSINEGLGRVVVEAMFFGCPVLARATGGVAEYAAQGENALLFNTVDELTGLLDNLDTFDLPILAEKAQRFALENFSEEVYGKKIMNIYKSILK